MNQNNFSYYKVSKGRGIKGNVEFYINFNLCLLNS